MEKKQKISLTICAPRWFEKSIHFDIGISGLKQKYLFEAKINFPLPKISVDGFPGTENHMNKSELLQKGFIPIWTPARNVNGLIVSEAVEEVSPIVGMIFSINFTEQEFSNLKEFIFHDPKRKGKALIAKANRMPESQISPKACTYFGTILVNVLGKIGYLVEIEEILEHFFASPTSTAYLAPAFALGLQKNVKPIKTEDGYETTLIYLSYEKPQSKTGIQLSLLDDIPEEKLSQIQRRFQDALSPYGLKCLYLAIEECGKNRRFPWFNLDTNRSLDLLGYKRNKKGVHGDKNKKRFLKEMADLTQINFNVERRAPDKKGKKNKEQALRFQAPLLSITGKFEEWEVDIGKPIEEGVRLQDGIQIFLHPEIYKYIDSFYTFVPHEFLKIDISRTPHALYLYHYIANQWRIGWHKYHGIIQQSVRQLLDGSGLLSRLPKRRNQQRDFVGKIKKDLEWLQEQPLFWIQSVRFESKNKPFLEAIVTICMAQDHPLRSQMLKHIEE